MTGFYRLNLFLMLCALCLVQACGNHTENSQDADGKLKYEPKVNSVEVIRLENKTFVRQIVANGKLCARARSSMAFKTSGVIVEANVENGQYIQKGSVIARQDAENLELAMEAARIALDKARLDYYDVLVGQGYAAEDTVSVPDNVKTMARMRSGYDAAYNNLRKAESDYRGAVLKAPFSGKVADVKLQKFDMSGTEPFCTIIDDSVFDVDFVVLESEYQLIEKGLSVKVEPFATENRSPLEGRITSINPSVDKNGQVAVKASVRNDGSLVDGMNVKVFVEKPAADMLVVPKSAVIIRDNEEVLFRYSRGQSVWTYVNVIMANSRECAVSANAERGAELNAGDTVIVSGNLNLADGSKVEIKQ